ALEIAAMLLELCLEAAEQRKAVGGRAGKAREHTILVEPAHLARLVLDDGLTERHLAVAGHHDAIAMADGKNGRRVKAGHESGVGRTWSGKRSQERLNPHRSARADGGQAPRPPRRAVAPAPRSQRPSSPGEAHDAHGRGVAHPVQSKDGVSPTGEFTCADSPRS